jgi:hypothetical protein
VSVVKSQAFSDIDHSNTIGEVRKVKMGWKNSSGVGANTQRRPEDFEQIGS